MKTIEYECELVERPDEAWPWAAHITADGNFLYTFIGKTIAEAMESAAEYVQKLSEEHQAPRKYRWNGFTWEEPYVDAISAYEDDARQRELEDETRDYEREEVEEA